MRGGCGLLDTQTPNIIDPGGARLAEAPASFALGALADFVFVEGRRRDRVRGWPDPGGRPAVRRIRHSTTPPSEQEIDQRSTALINPTVQTSIATCTRPGPARTRRGGAADSPSVEPDSTTDIAEMLTLAGFTYVYFAEDFCSGVPFSKVVRRFSGLTAPPRPRPRCYDTALARFDSALAQPGLADDDGTITNLATVGRARALLDLGLFAEAAAAASTCRPTSPMTPSIATVRSGFRTRSSYTNGPLVGVGLRRAVSDWLTARRRTRACR